MSIPRILFILALTISASANATAPSSDSKSKACDEFNNSSTPSESAITKCIQSGQKGAGTCGDAEKSASDPNKAQLLNGCKAPGEQVAARNECNANCNYGCCLQQPGNYYACCSQ